MNLSTYEELEQVAKQKTKKDKIATLQKFAGSNIAIPIILDLTFNPGWKWLLPEGEPPYNPSTPEQDLQAVLKKDSRKLMYFINTKEGNSLKPLRRETMYIEFLESVDPDDAKLLLSIKNGKLPFNGFTKKLVKEAFPDQTKNW